MEIQQTKIGSRIIGNHEEAEAWISQSEVSDENKQLLLRFVQKFPSITYYKWDKLERFQDTPWLYRICQTLGGFAPGLLAWVRFGGFSSAFSDKSEVAWYNRQNSADVSFEYDHLFLGDYPLFILFARVENLDSILAVKLGCTNDQAVYEFSYSDVVERNHKEGEVSKESVRVAFQSYVEMLDSVTAIKIESAAQEAEVIEAQVRMPGAWPGS